MYLYCIININEMSIYVWLREKSSYPYHYALLYSECST